MNAIETYRYNYFVAGNVLKTRPPYFSNLNYLNNNIHSQLFSTLEGSVIIDINHNEQKVTMNDKKIDNFVFTPEGGLQDYETNLYYQLLKSLREDREQNYGIFTKVV